METAHGGTYQQSSLWAQVKATVSWRCIRLVVHCDGDVVAGCQVLVRSLGQNGLIGYVSHGPLVADSDPDALAVVLQALKRLVKEKRILYLKLQPPPDRNDMPPILKKWGFIPSGVDTAPSMTTRVNLRQSPADALATMRKTTRRNIRQAQRRGVVIREGGDKDLPIFHSLVEATSRRQGFAPYPRGYVERMWRVFNEKGHAHLLMAEYQGDVLASSFVIGFGDTVVSKTGGWLGVDRSIRPNELLEWAGMQWGMEQGYRYYDLEGIDQSVGEAILAGRSREHIPFHGASHYKLGFGGEVVQFPQSYDYSCYQLLLLGLHWLAPRLRQLDPVAHRLLGRQRQRRAN